MNLFIFAQILGGLGAISMMLSSWQKSRKKIFVFLLFDNIFYLLQYIVLGAYAGAITNVVGLVRTILFSKKGKNKFLSSNYPFAIVIFLYIILNVFTYDGLFSLFPSVASIVYAIVLWQDEPKKIRMGSSFMLFMWFIYNLVVRAYVGALTEFCLFVSSVIAIIKIDLKHKSEVIECEN